MMFETKQFPGSGNSSFFWQLHLQCPTFGLPRRDTRAKPENAKGSPEMFATWRP